MTTLEANFGLTYKKLNSENYAQIHDLMGSDYHEDVDPFSKTLNDINGAFQKKKADIFNYRYGLDASQFDAFAQLRYNQNNWNAFLSGSISTTSSQREGFFQNERFPDNSFGKSKGREIFKLWPQRRIHLIN